jgi:hypothetical protein
VHYLLPPLGWTAAEGFHVIKLTSHLQLNYVETLPNVKSDKVSQKEKIT